MDQDRQYNYPEIRDIYRRMVSRIHSYFLEITEDIHNNDCFTVDFIADILAENSELVDSRLAVKRPPKPDMIAKIVNEADSLENLDQKILAYEDCCGKLLLNSGIWRDKESKSFCRHLYNVLERIYRNNNESENADYVSLRRKNIEYHSILLSALNKSYINNEQKQYEIKEKVISLKYNEFYGKSALELPEKTAPEKKKHRPVSQDPSISRKNGEYLMQAFDRLWQYNAKKDSKGINSCLDQIFAQTDMIKKSGNIPFDWDSENFENAIENWLESWFKK